MQLFKYYFIAQTQQMMSAYRPKGHQKKDLYYDP